MNIVTNQNFAVNLNAKNSKTPAFKANFTATDEAKNALKDQYNYCFLKMESNKRRKCFPEGKDFNLFFENLKTVIQRTTKDVKGTILLAALS